MPIADELNIDRSPNSDVKQGFSIARSLSNHGAPSVVEVVPISEQDTHEARAGLLAEHNSADAQSENNRSESTSRAGCTRRRVLIFAGVATVVAVVVILLAVLSGPRTSPPPKHTTIMISLGEMKLYLGLNRTLQRLLPRSQEPVSCKRIKEIMLKGP